MLQDVKSYFGRCFTIKDLGEAAYILGINIYRDRSWRLIGLCQSAYIKKVLKRFHMENSKRGSIPMQEKQKLSKSQGASTPAELKSMQNVPYASVVGSIMVSCYTNAGYMTDADDLKSQTGYVFVLNGGVVDWKSIKQSIFATSSAEAEYIAAYDASKESVWVRKFIFGLGIVPIIEEPIKMYCDNTRAIAIANELGITKGARHFRAQVHYLREVIEYGDIKLEKVHTYDNLADPFTKALAFPKHSKHTKNIGMLSASGLIKKNKHTIDERAKNKDVNRIDSDDESRNDEGSCNKDNGGIEEQGNEVNNQVIDEVSMNKVVSNEPVENCQSNVSNSEHVVDSIVNNENDDSMNNIAHQVRVEGTISIDSYAKKFSNGNDNLNKEFIYIPTGELKYNLRRMWGKHGLSEIIADGSDMRIFKFNNAKGMNYLLNVPLEAWSVRGISTLANRLIMMDNITASMCHNGSGRAGYARILVEIDAKKGIQDLIEVDYKDALNCTKNKFIKVEYTWKPALCIHCGVFGHSDKTCKHQVKDDTGRMKGKEQFLNEVVGNNGRNNAFTEVRRRPNLPKYNGGPSTSYMQNNQKRVISKYVVKNKEILVNETRNKVEDVKNMEKKKNNAGITKEEGQENICCDDRIKVDWYVLRKERPKEEETVNWTYDMKKYLECIWEALNRKDDESDEENEVLEVNDHAIENLIAEEIQGSDTQLLN
ncbi:retrotransposon protein, putative, ty1-copia subclass [Tanacetum coccineum]